MTLESQRRDVCVVLYNKCKLYLATGITTQWWKFERHFPVVFRAIGHKQTGVTRVTHFLKSIAKFIPLSPGKRFALFCATRLADGDSVNHTQTSINTSNTYKNYTAPLVVRFNGQ